MIYPLMIVALLSFLLTALIATGLHITRFGALLALDVFVAAALIFITLFAMFQDMPLSTMLRWAGGFGVFMGLMGLATRFADRVWLTPFLNRRSRKES